MAITLDGMARPKIVTTNSISPQLSVATAVEVDSTEESFFIPIRLTSTNPPSFTVASVTVTSGSPTLTTTGGGFSAVKVGDVVSGTGIAAGAVVTAKNVNNNSLTLDQNSTQSTSATITFDPPAGTPDVFALKVILNKSGNTLSLMPELHVYDGSLAPGVQGTDANFTKKYSLVDKNNQALVIDLDTFLTNYRVFRLS